MSLADRRTGKTTRLVEEAVRILGEIPETHKVFITGAHTKWLLDLRTEFKAEGLIGVEFLTLHQIQGGALRSRRGVLLIDDLDDLNYRDREFLYYERQFLESKDLDREHFIKTGEMRNRWTHLSIPGGRNGRRGLG